MCSMKSLDYTHMSCFSNVYWHRSWNSVANKCNCALNKSKPKGPAEINQTSCMSVVHAAPKWLIQITWLFPKCTHTHTHRQSNMIIFGSNPLTECSTSRHDSRVTTCPVWPCEKSLACRRLLFFKLIFSRMMDSDAHIDLCGEKCSRSRTKTETIGRRPEGDVAPGSLVCVVSPSLPFSVSPSELKQDAPPHPSTHTLIYRDSHSYPTPTAPHLPLSCCKHSTALQHISFFFIYFFVFLIMHNTKG